jgi:hypothetical protein
VVSASKSGAISPSCRVMTASLGCYPFYIGYFSFGIKNKVFGCLGKPALWESQHLV